MSVLPLFIWPRSFLVCADEFLLLLLPANSGLHVFDFLSNSILKEIHSAIQKGKPGAFSPGKPGEFLANYKASLKFLNFLEGMIHEGALARHLSFLSCSG